MSRQAFFLWPLWLLFVVQGCTRRVREKVTINLEGQRVTLQFSYLEAHRRHGRIGTPSPLKEVFNILETKKQIDPKTGKKIDLNEPQASRMLPLEMAIRYALGRFYNNEGNEDTNFYAARYLLAHGADPDDLRIGFSAMHALCASLGFEREIDIRGLSLFLSYGARLDIKDEDGETPIDILERYKPWISEELREQLDWGTATSKREKKRLKGEQKRLKKEYFTEVAEKLFDLKQHRRPVDPKFLKYIKKAGVDSKLVNKLSAREPAS